MTQPPGTGSLLDQLNDLRRQVAELTRKAPAMPACRAVLSASLAIPSGDSYAPGTWIVREDPLGWFTAAAPSYITIPVDGFYQLTYHSATGGLGSGAVGASKILRNGTSPIGTYAIASDLRVSSGTSEGVVQNCFRARVQLALGDKIYWSNYASASGAQLFASQLNVPTEMTVQFISSR